MQISTYMCTHTCKHSFSLSRTQAFHWCDEHYYQKQLVEEWSYFTLEFFIKVNQSGNSSRNLEAGIDGEATEEHCLLAGLPCFLIQSRTSCSGDTTHSRLGPLLSIHNQENAPQTFTLVSLMGTIPQLWFSLLKYVFIYYKLIKKNQNTDIHTCTPHTIQK